MLGHDAQRQEYWHFKDDPARIYIRREEQIQLQNAIKSIDMEDVENSMLNQAQMQNGDEGEVQHKVKISWFYYDTDVEVDTLLNICLNPKGQRERALQATMR
jgi:hypothetical protein